MRVTDLYEIFMGGGFESPSELREVVEYGITNGDSVFLQRYISCPDELKNTSDWKFFTEKYLSRGIVINESEIEDKYNISVECQNSILDRVFYQVVRETISLCYNSGESSVIESILMYFITYVCGLSNQGYRTWISMYLSCHCDIVDKLDLAFPGCFTEKELKFLKRFHVNNKFAFDIAEEFNVTIQNVDCVLTCCYSKIYRAILIYYRGLFKEVV